MLCSVWNAGKHAVAVEVQLRIMLKHNLSVTQAQLWEALTFNDDGSLCGWNLTRCKVEVLPEEFGRVRTTTRLGLAGNQLCSPESFGNITAGGGLWSLYSA